jgi:3-oxoadipate enol-lactonase
VEQVREVMDQAGVERATVCGVSYGGLIAAAFAARHPERAESLVLMSALPPSWRPDARVRFYLRAPRLLTPVFMLASLRMYREIAVAHPGLRAGLREAARHGGNVLAHMFSPTRMARRVHLLDAADVSRVRALDLPALVITGEPSLDRVVPVSATREYAEWLPQARLATVERTGHLGFITRPEAVADLVAEFAGADGTTQARRRIG